MKIHIESYENRRKFLLLSALLLFVISVCGTIAYAFRAGFRGPDGWALFNPFVGFWFTIVLGGLALEIVLVLTIGGRKINCCINFDFIYFGHILVCFVLIGVFYTLYGRYDLSAFSIFIVVAAAVNVFAVVTVQNCEDQYAIRGFNTCLLVILWVLRAIAVILVVLLAVGAGQHGVGAVIHCSEKDQYLELKLPDDRTQSVRYRCFGSGDNTDTLPVLLFEGRPYNGYADWIGVKNAAIEKKMRVCLWDRPGVGYSDYSLAYQAGSEDYLPYLMEALKEKEEKYQPPYIMVGWAELGAGAVYKYAQDQPEDVKGLVFIDALNGEEEWDLRARAEGAKEDEYQEKRDTYICWLTFGTVMKLLLGAPFGLATIEYDFSWKSDYWDDTEKSELIWSYSINKPYSNLYWEIDTWDSEKSKSDLFDGTLNEDIPIHALISSRTKEQVKKMVCKKYNLDDKVCEEVNSYEEYRVEAEKKHIRNDGQVKLCKDDDCGVYSMVYKKPEWIIEQIRSLFS